MDKREARRILEQELLRYRKLSHNDLLYLLDNQDSFERTSPSGTIYQLEFEGFWDDEFNRHLRIRGCIDDGGWRALSPLCEDFILRPDGSCVDE